MANAENITEDYRESLEALVENNRWIISNLTVIAKESTEHAEAISTVLLEHIAKAPPNHKLPALYVLDSIAKNIGTPYTLFLGHRLYNTFMGAYSLVDHSVRKKLDEMLKTWKQPVPGSLDPRPVFENAITKKIETALIQARTQALQIEQQQQKAQQVLLRRRAPGTTSSTQWRNTPTPPQSAPRIPTPSSQGFIQYQTNDPPQTNFAYPPNSQFAQHGQFSSQAQPPSSYQNQSQSTAVLPLLEHDVQHLINKYQESFTRNHNDRDIQTKLKALGDLQTILRTQDLPLDQLQLIRAQLDALQAAHKAQFQSSIPVPASAPLPTSSTQSVPLHSTLAYQPPHQPPYQQSAYPLQHQLLHPPNATPALPSSDFLANLLASAGRSHTPQSLPQIHHPVPPKPDPALPSIPVAENPLLAQLRASGLLSSLGTPPSNAGQIPVTGNVSLPPSAATPAPLNLSALLQSRPPLTERPNGIELTSASLKVPRPHLIAKLYEAQPNQCLTCGKRFLSTEDGRSRKARHMDWHFRTNQRLADAAQRGQSRSWYVGELDWIKFRDDEEWIDGSTTQGADKNSLIVPGMPKNDPKTKFILVPSENDLPCAICQEEFVTSWNEELQEFVWMDAMKVGDRVYHATCYADFKKDGGHTPARTATPDSVLGKRKADVGTDNPSPAKRERESDD